MSTVYNPEADIMAEIERLDLEAKDLRRKIEHSANEEDRRVLTEQLQEIAEQITLLQKKLP